MFCVFFPPSFSFEPESLSLLSPTFSKFSCFFFEIEGPSQFHFARNVAQLMEMLWKIELYNFSTDCFLLYWLNYDSVS